MNERLTRTAFYTALIGYLLFALLEYAVPGFVSFNFSVHLFGLFVLLFGVAWAGLANRAESSTIGTVLAGFTGVVMAVVVWQEGEAYGDFRPLLALGVLFLPWLSRRLLSIKDN